MLWVQWNYQHYVLQLMYVWESKADVSVLQKILFNEPLDIYMGVNVAVFLLFNFK